MYYRNYLDYMRPAVYLSLFVKSLGTCSKPFRRVFSFQQPEHTSWDMWRGTSQMLSVMECPVYSPNLNPIELLWKEFKGLKDMTKLLHRPQGCPVRQLMGWYSISASLAVCVNCVEQEQLLRDHLISYTHTISTYLNYAQSLLYIIYILIY